MTWLQLVLSLCVVTLGAEFLVRGASLLALRAGVSSLFVGLTIVGIGTSTPELGASLYATLQDSSGVSVGNVIGSNLFNIGVILGLTALISPIHVELSAVRRELRFAVAVACTPFIALAFGGDVPRVAGAAMVLGLTAYLVLAFRAGRRAHADQLALAGVEVRSTLSIDPTPRLLDATWMNVLFVLLGMVGLLLGSRWFVTLAISIASSSGLSEHVIGLTIVSAGTSLPELVTSIVAARRGNSDIAVGNVIGSNIFNILGVLGVCATVRAQQVPAQMLAVDVPLMLIASICLLPMVRSGSVISRREGALLLGGYGVYLGWLLS
jgi:cation:H+ antiporter